MPDHHKGVMADHLPDKAVMVSHHINNKVMVDHHHQVKDMEVLLLSRAATDNHNRVMVNNSKVMVVSNSITDLLHHNLVILLNKVVTAHHLHPDIEQGRRSLVLQELLDGRA
jgi:hypothetical protein